MEIQTIHIDLIRPYWRNPRNNDKAVEVVRESIKRYGYNQPIAIDTDNVIIAGHTRYKALRELGYENIACVVLDIDEEKAKEYRINDNKSNEFADWDDDKLMFELREIEELEGMEVFFGKGELDNLIEDQAFSVEEMDEEATENQVRAQITTKAQVASEDDEDEDEVSDEEIERQVQEEMERKREEQRQRELEAENRKIKQKEKEEAEKYQKKTQENEDDYVEIQCPHCDEKYVLSRSELLRTSKLRKTL